MCDIIDFLKSGTDGPALFKLAIAIAVILAIASRFYRTSRNGGNFDFIFSELELLNWKKYGGYAVAQVLILALATMTFLLFPWINRTCGL
jgi:hypothetical protein